MEMKPCKTPACAARSLRNSEHCLACTKKVTANVRDIADALSGDDIDAIRAKLEGFLVKSKERDRERSLELQRLHRSLRRDVGVQWASVTDMNNTEAVKIK